MQQNYLMATIDLKDAYFLILAHQQSRKFFRISFENNIYEFTCLPFGLWTAPYVFTKLMKPVMSFFRQRGISCVIYLDDLIVFSKTEEECKFNIGFIKDSLETLGFIINPERVVLYRQDKFVFKFYIQQSKYDD